MIAKDSDDDSQVISTSGSIESAIGRSHFDSASVGSIRGSEVVSGARKLIEHDSLWIRRSKATLMWVMFVAATAASTAAFVYSKVTEENDYRVRFRDFSRQIISVSQLNAVNIFRVYESMSRTMTAVQLTANSSWPNVLFTNYEALASDSMLTTGANWVSYSPLVTGSQRASYEQFTYANQQWIQAGLDYQESDVNVSLTTQDIFCHNGTIRRSELEVVACPEADEFYPIAQLSPIETASPFLNLDGLSIDFFKIGYEGMLEVKEAVLSHVLNLDGVPTFEEYWPVSFMAAPVFSEIGHAGEDHPGNLVAIISAELPWHRYFLNLIPENVDGFMLVVRNTCDQTFSYIINGPEVVYLGVGDFHDIQYDYLEMATNFTAFKSIPSCQYSISVYPTDEFKDEYMTLAPMYAAMATFLLFALTAFVFIVYDRLVHIRQLKLLSSAEQTSAIVNSLFPENVRERLIEDAEKIVNTRQSAEFGERNPENWKIAQSNLIDATKPIADLFPKATVLFADLVGFTAWSSIREPSQVFTLLETLYASFDKLAKRLRVFKVETIGDCYVAATGLPSPRKDHAVAMARFARMCLAKLNQTVLELQYTLGPGTSELSMRVGMHSGPVTAGVLRGEKSRFQLFGDTVNTAARMESTGQPNRIQLSQQTADRIEEAGKEDWLEKRTDLVVAKGKGKLQTYWLRTTQDSSSSDRNMAPDQIEVPTTSGETKEMAMDALVGWNTEFLQQLLKKVVAGRGKIVSVDLDEIDKLTLSHEPGKIILDEVVDDISLPEALSDTELNPNSVQLSVEVSDQLRDFVKTIASMHTEDVSFHCFEHSSHVCQSVGKLFARMLGPDQVDYTNMTYNQSRGALELHEETYGIASDPLAQFACGFAALVHDVDHPGVPNEILVKENSHLFKLYGEKSIAKQNAVEVSWGLLMESRYRELRACIYNNQDELKRFRSLVVNAVISTDVCNADANTSQVEKWQDAFTSQLDLGGTSVKRKAMAIVENLLAASDHSHAMQHWIVYIKWNELMFDELYTAYRNGRIQRDPSVTWYKEELDLFSSRIIPVAENLQVCGVFGSACDEYLGYALNNKKEWEQKGRELIREFVNKFPREVYAGPENLYDIF